jgi:CHAD domain-containing protein
MGSDVHGLHAGMPFCAAAKPAIGQKLDELFQHEAGTRAGDDIEALHDMRVASRRLRAAMDIFGVCFPAGQFKPLYKMARSLTRALGEVRDRDVLIETLERHAKRAPEDEKPGVAELVRVLRDERDVYRGSLMQTLDAVEHGSFRYKLYILLMGESGADGKPRKKGELDPRVSLQEHARLIAVERVADLYGFEPFIQDPANVTELHEMRIAAKHLRYALEILRVCYGPDVEDRIADIKSIQEQIGEIHDCDVLIEVLKRQLSVVAQRMQEALVAQVTEPIPHEGRMARVRSMLEGGSADDPRPGILALLSVKTDERSRRYRDFVDWWEDHRRGDLRGKLYSCIAAVSGSVES